MAAQVDIEPIRFINTSDPLEHFLPSDSVRVLLLIRDAWLAMTNNGINRTVVKAKDPCNLFGEYCSQSAKTRVGIILRWLSTNGYLIEIRSKKYLPTPLFIQWALTCQYPKCETEGSVCGLIEVCPVHRLKQVIEKRKRR